MIMQKMALPIMGLLLGLDATIIRATPILTVPTLPDHYHCQGKNADLTLHTSALGETTLILKLDSIVHKVSQSEIDTENTMLGDIKEMTIGFKPEISVTKASVIIPTILLDSTVPQPTI